MIKFNNLNNLSEYLKKSDAENIYMKKINSLNISFTELLTSISNKFTLYDYEILTINNSFSSLCSSVSSVISSYSSLLESFNTYTSNNDSVISEIISSLTLLNTHSSFVDSQISSLWEAVGGGGEGEGYNYWKELARASQYTYLSYGENPETFIDHEGIKYSSNITNLTLINNSKDKYVLNTNMLTIASATGSYSFSGELNRLGLIVPPPSTTSSAFNSLLTYPMNCPHVTVKSCDIKINYPLTDFNTGISVKCLDAYFINSTEDNAVYQISTGLNATKINFYNYLVNDSITSTFWLNDRVNILGGWNGNTAPKIDLRRNITNNLPTLTFTDFKTARVINLTNGSEAGYGIGPIECASCKLTNYDNYTFNIKCDTVTLSALNKSNNQTYNLSFPNDLQAKYIIFTNESLVNLNLPNAITNTKFVFRGDNRNISQTAELNSFDISSYGLYNVPTLSIIDNTFNKLIISYNSGTSDLWIKDFSMTGNSIQTLTFGNRYSLVQNFNNNTINTLYYYDYENKGLSFGANFSNNNFILYSGIGGTYYSYNNPSAFVSFTTCPYKILDLTCSKLILAAGDTIENVVCDSLKLFNVPGNYGPWKYLWANTVEYVNDDKFMMFRYKLNMDSAFYHCPFLQLSGSAFSSALNNPNIGLEHNDVLVDNAPTTSINLKLTGTNTAKSVNVNFINNQSYIVLADIRGWHPDRIIDFDQSYLFNNVAIGYSNVPDQKFTAVVDDTANWSNYKMFFNPFGTPDADRIVLQSTL